MLRVRGVSPCQVAVGGANGESEDMARYVVTGIAGFIGFHVASCLLRGGHEVTGIDAFTDYYDVGLKRSRAKLLEAFPGCRIYEQVLGDLAALRRIEAAQSADVVIHLAGQVGVRHSLKDPRSYVDANVVGAFNVLELARESNWRHLMLASTSSVYGSGDFPFRESDKADRPLTIYAATKKSMELMAHCYSHLWSIPTTVFRFFSVYGPWGRPDMAYFMFTKGILAGEPIDVYNGGKMQRDFTYVDDLVDAIARLSSLAPLDPRRDRLGASPAGLASDVAPYRVVNIGRGQPVNLLDFIRVLEERLGRTALKNHLPTQAGDPSETRADTTLLESLIGSKPSVPIEVGLGEFVDWYRSYYG